MEDDQEHLPFVCEIVKFVFIGDRLVAVKPVLVDVERVLHVELKLLGVSQFKDFVGPVL